MCVALLIVAPGGRAAAETGSVLDTVHNLSVSGPGAIRSETETEVCKFCHIPHNAEVPVPLWGRPLSQAKYDVPELGRGRPDTRPAPQPNGASRLCLSCHDGTVALGDLAGGRRVEMAAGRQQIGPRDRGYLGTDLSGSHPISISMPQESVLAEDDDMTLRLAGDGRTSGVAPLDEAGQIQCTTCHDAHSDAYYESGRVPRFWVAPTVDEVCNACHVLN